MVIVFFFFFYLQTKLSYKNTKVHRIVQDFVVQMGDTTVGDGTGGNQMV